MKILVHELRDTLRQKITVGTKALMLHAIRPHIYKHGSPAGSLYLQIQDADGKKIADSAAVTLASISSVNYFHGYVRFLISVPLMAGTSYHVALKSTGYTYGGSAFVGWCNDYDLRKVDATYTNVSTRGRSAPLDMEFWTYTQLLRGQV